MPTPPRRDLSKAVRYALRNLIDIEIACERDIKWRQYMDILNDIYGRLRVPLEDRGALNLNSEIPPAWILNDPEIYFYWSRARLAYLDRRAIVERRKSA